MRWKVKKVEVTGPQSLFVEFQDGTQGDVELRPSFLYGVFESLKDPIVFGQVHIEHGAVTWPGRVDLAPDAMHREIKRSGRFVLE